MTGDGLRNLFVFPSQDGVGWETPSEGITDSTSGSWIVSVKPGFV